MKKVVDGKVYDTAKSVEIAIFQYSNPHDFNHVDERLYQSPNGQFFLAGSGGPKTKYAQNVGNGSTSGGSDIELLTESEARQWLENHQDRIDEDITKIYQEYFPESLKEG